MAVKRIEKPLPVQRNTLENFQNLLKIASVEHFGLWARSWSVFRDILITEQNARTKNISNCSSLQTKYVTTLKSSSNYPELKLLKLQSFYIRLEVLEFSLKNMLDHIFYRNSKPFFCRVFVICSMSHFV